MSLRFCLLFIISLTPALGAVSPNNLVKPSNYEQEYAKALDNPDLKSSCQTFKKLAGKNDFLLKDLAAIRANQHCKGKARFSELEKKLKSNEVLHRILVQSWFDRSQQDKNYKAAYLLYKNNRKIISLDKKEFEELAQKALKTNLGKKDKNFLRKELRRRSPRFIPRPNKSQYLKVARDHRKARNFETALTYYRKVINDPKRSYHDRWYGFKGARFTYKIERWSRMKKYIRASKQWADFLRTKYKWSKEMTRMHHDANIEYIRTLWTEKGQNQAKPELLKLEKEVKGRHSLQIVYWLKGRMAEERKNYKEAVNWLSKASKEKSLSVRDNDRVLWALAWNQRRTKDFASSQETLEKLKKSPELTHFSNTKYRYWQAENFESMNKTSEAKKAFTNLAKLDVFGYYGALSLRKLNQAFPEVPRAKYDVDESLSFFNKKDRPFFRSLVAANDLEVASEMVVRKVTTKKSWPTDKWISYLKLLHFAGDYKKAFVRYHSLEPKKQLTIMEDHSYLLFPRPYLNQVSKSAELTKVSPALIYSIMKQESGFDVKARSHVDAFGLLQLIPQVASKAAKRMPSVAYKKPDDLFKPEVIIPLGANELKNLFKRFQGNFIISVASYNANEKAVRGWVKTRYQGDPISFIEDIPYEETKGYVKLVMRNYIAYNRFSNQQGEVFKFPETCLDGLTKFQ